MQRYLWTALIAAFLAVNAFLMIKHGVWTRWDAWSWLVSR